MDALLYNIQQKHLKLFVELNISCLLYQGCWFCLLTAHCVIFGDNSTYFGRGGIHYYF